MKKLIFLIFVLLPSLLLAQSFPSKPDNYVTDKSQLLSTEELKHLNDTLAHFEKKTSNQVFVLIDDTLYGYELEYVTQQIAQKWGAGQKGLDNGVLLAVFLKDRKLRIEVGYGLEGYLPDLEASNIIQNGIAPNFKTADYYRGIEEGVHRIMEATDTVYIALKEKQAEEYAKQLEIEEAEKSKKFSVYKKARDWYEGVFTAMFVIFPLSYFLSLRLFKSFVKEETKKIGEDEKTGNIEAAIIESKRKFNQKQALYMLAIVGLWTLDNVLFGFISQTLTMFLEYLDEMLDKGTVVYLILFGFGVFYFLPRHYVHSRLKGRARLYFVLICGGIPLLGFAIGFLVVMIVHLEPHVAGFYYNAKEELNIFYRFFAGFLAAHFFMYSRVFPKSSWRSRSYSSSGSSYKPVRSSYNPYKSTYSSYSSSSSGSYSSSSSSSYSSSSSSSSSFSGGGGGSFGGGGASGSW